MPAMGTADYRGEMIEGGGVKKIEGLNDMELKYAVLNESGRKQFEFYNIMGTIQVPLKLYQPRTNNLHVEHKPYLKFSKFLWLRRPNMKQKYE